MLAHLPRFQALLDESRMSILAGKGFSRGAFWKAVAACQREKGRDGRSAHYALHGGTATICRIFETCTAMTPNPL